MYAIRSYYGIKALNLFLEDLYTDKKIVKQKIVPEEFIYQAKGYLKELQGFSPSKKLRTHINGIDLVKDSVSDDWIILEDNLRVPSGASYPLSIRNTFRKIYPDFFEKMDIKPIKDYATLLKESMNYVNCEGINVVLTPGRFNSAYYEHAYLADITVITSYSIHYTKLYEIKDYATILKESMNYVNCEGINVVLTPGRFNSAYYEHAYLADITGSILVRNSELVVENKILYFKNYNGKKVKVGSVYRRLDDEFLDPKFFNEESLIGVPGIMEAYLAGNVAIMNAPGNGVADDKGIYYFVPQMIKYYLNEEPILKNAPTYLPYFEKDKKYIFRNNFVQHTLYEVIRYLNDPLDNDNDGVPNSYEDDDNDGIYNKDDSQDNSQNDNDDKEENDNEKDDDDTNNNSNISSTLTLPTSYSQNDGRLLASQCFQCHGTNGVSTNSWDSIAGEDEMDEVFGEDAIMDAQAHGYTTQELNLIGSYLKTLSRNNSYNFV